MALNLGKSVVDYLIAHPEEKFSARQIAEWIVVTFPDECHAKKASSQALETDADLLQQLVAEIGSQRSRLQKRHPNLKTTEGRPRKYYFSEKSDSAEVAAVESSGVTAPVGKDQTKIGEHGLYPLLSSYLWAEFGVYSKRIDEKVKLLINRSNVRECFFQSVSNSSWSNFGYLVAAEIEGQDTLKELRMLFSAHGIGLIKLDVESPSESQVLIPAKERGEIDWDTANRLTTENRDFLEYVKLIKQFYQTGEARLADWDVPKGSE
jgi:hypothetical protein